MITGAHAVLFTTDADADREFFRDVLEFPSVDAGSIRAPSASTQRFPLVRKEQGWSQCARSLQEGVAAMPSASSPK